jgi:ABC-type multidrug transport system fused ATPase/permease subunit
MQDGRIIETGIHQALLEKNGAYARLWRLQQEESRREQITAAGE